MHFSTQKEKRKIITCLLTFLKCSKGCVMDVKTLKLMIMNGGLHTYMHFRTRVVHILGKSLKKPLFIFFNENIYG